MALIIGRKQNYRKANVAVCLNFLYNGAAFISLFVKDNRFEPDLFKVASHAFASTLVMTMNNKNPTRYYSFNGFAVGSGDRILGLGKFNFLLKRINRLL